MENFDIERLHADCLKWCENPVWKPWQQEYRLEKMTGNYRRILDKHRSLIASLYDDSDLYDGLPTMQFAHLIGLNVESYRKEAAPEPTHSRLSAFLILQNEFGWERDKKDSWRWYKDAYTIRVLDSCNGKTSCFLVCKKVGSDTPIDFLFDYGKEDGLRKWLGRFDEAPTPEKEIETIEQEANEILIGKGFEWNEVHKEWRKKELQIWHGDDGYYFARFHNHNIPIRLPSMPFASWVESVEKMTAEPEKEIEAAPLSGLLKGDGNLLSAHSAFRKALEDRFQPTLECLTNDRQDRIELLKLAVQMATEYSKKESGMKFGFATETFYKQLCKLAGMDDPQSQTVEAPKPEQPAAEQGKVECTITRMELVPCNFGGVEFGYAAIDAKGKKYLFSHYGSDEVATAEVLRLAHSTMASAGAVRLEDLIGRKILVAPSESNALLLPLEFV